MTLLPTLKHLSIAIVSIAMAILVVCALFILQALSISLPTKEISAVQIYSMPEFHSVPQEKKNVSKKYTSQLSGSGMRQALNVKVPSIDSSDFALPNAYMVSAQSNKEDFSVALFDDKTGESFASDVFSVDMLDKIPQRIDRTEVEYPKQMLKRGIEGFVKLEVVIDEAGIVAVEKVLSSTNAHFSKCAFEAVNKFQYEVPTKSGKPVKARFTLDIPFKIRRQ